MAETTEDTQHLILRTAESLFARYGYAAVSMNQIVEAASKVRKLSKPAIYYHFADKEALFVAVVLAMMAHGGREIAAAVAQPGDLRDRLRAIAAAIQQGQSHVSPRLLGEVDAALSDERRALLEVTFRRSIIGPIVAVFEEAIAAGEVRADISPFLAAHTLFHLVGSFAFGRQMFDAPVDVPETVTRVLLDGIAAR